VDRQIRGLSPFPGAWFMAPQAVGMDRPPARIKALLSRTEPGSGAPGQALDDELDAGGEWDEGGGGFTRWQ
jgi:methionyl-tRNA formyltransferase